MKPGQYYGLYCMITDGPLFQQVAAAADVSVIRVHIASIRAILKNRPELSEKFAHSETQRMDGAQAARLQSQKALMREYARRYLGLRQNEYPYLMATVSRPGFSLSIPAFER